MRLLCCILVFVASALAALCEEPALAQLAPAAAPSAASPSPVPVIPYDINPDAYIIESPRPLNTAAPLGNQVLYVVADGGDSSTRGRFVSEVTRQLQSFYQIPAGLILVPEPSWAVSDYMNACANVTANTKTRGALVVEVASISNSSANWFWQKASWTELSGALLFSSCIQDHSKSSTGSGPSTSEATPNPLTPISQKEITWQFEPKKRPLQSLQRIKYSTFNTPAPKATPPPPYAMRWATNVYDQTGYTKNVTPLPVVGVMLSLVTVGIPFIPSRTSTGQDTVVYPTPYPWLPGSSNGYVSQRQTTNTTTTNTQNETTLATGFLSSSITYDQNLNALPSTSDDSSMRAVRNVVAGFLREIGCNASGPLKLNLYGIDVKSVPIHGGMCADLAIQAPPSLRPVGQLVPEILHAKFIDVTAMTTTVRAPNSAYGCSTPSPTSIAQAQASPSTPPPCGIEITAEIQNLTKTVPLPVPETSPKPEEKGRSLALSAVAIDLFRLRCKGIDQNDLIMYNEAAEPFGPLPLDPMDRADYDFYLSNVMTQKRDENGAVHMLESLRCYMSFRVGETWYNASGVASGRY